MKIKKYFFIFIIIFISFVSGIFMGYWNFNNNKEMKYNELNDILKTENSIKHKTYTFNYNKKTYQIEKPYLKIVIHNYIAKHINSKYKSDFNYIDELTNHYIELIEKTNDIDMVLMYIALCKTESNFNKTATSCVGAYGIPQVMLNIWSSTMNKHWNISKYQYKNDLYSQLLVGLKIYEIQLKKQNGNIKKAHNSYSGGANNYHNKIIKQYNNITYSLYCFNIN